MPTYRVYRLNPHGHIQSGDWIDAEDEWDARLKAEELCAPDAFKVELWQGSTRIDEIECQRPTPTSDLS